MLKRILIIVFIITLFSSSIIFAHVTLESPAGGEQFKPGEKITIKWAVGVDHGDNNWDLYYSLNGGIVWYEIELDIETL